MGAVLPKGFELIPDNRQPVPDERLPESWQPPMGARVDPETGGARETIVGSLNGETGLPEGFQPMSDEDAWGSANGTDPLSLEEQEALASPPDGMFYDEKGNLYEEGDDPSQDAPRISAGGAAWRGMQSNALMGFDDELAGAAGAVGNKVGQWLGMNDTDIPMSEVYKQIRDKARNEKDAAYDQHLLAYGAGALPGMLLSAPFIGGKVAQGGTALRTAGNLAAAGARAGAVSGAGNSEDELGLGTIGDMAEGAVIGGIAAPVAAPIVNTIGGAAKAVKNAVFPRNTLNSGLEVLSRQAGDNLDPAAMRATAREMRAAGVEPRLVDVVDESGRGAIRAAAGKMTPAREELARHADEVYVSAQERVADQARRNITTPPGTARQLGRQIEEQQRQLGPQFDAVRGERVAITPEMVQAFSTAEGRSALRAISKWMEPEDAARLQGFIRAVGRASADPDAALRAQFPGDWDALPDAVKASIRQQMGAEADPFLESPLTVDVADKFVRVIRQRAGEIPAMTRVADTYSNIVRGAARQQYPEYAQALDEFAANARVGEAASGAGRFENTDFLRTPSDEYAAATSRASTEPAAIHRTIGTESVTPAPLDPARRDATELAWMEGRAMGASGKGGRLDPEEQAIHDDMVQDILSTGDDVSGESYYRGMSMTEEQFRDFMDNPTTGQRAVSYAFDRDIAADYATPYKGQRGVLMEVTMAPGTRAKSIANNEEIDEVITGPGKFRITEAEEIGSDVVRIKAEFVPDPLPTREITAPTVSERDALRMRARDDIVDRATSGSGAQAMATARQLSRGSAQRQRNRALLGEEQARQLERGMAAEVSRVDNTRYIDPRTNSQTFGREADAAELGLNVVANAASGGKWGVVGAVAQWLRNAGVRNVDAERLVRDAINPRRTREAIAFLEQRGLERARARSLVRSIAASMGGRVGGAVSYDKPEQPRSGTSLVNRSRQLDQGGGAGNGADTFQP